MMSNILLNGMTEEQMVQVSQLASKHRYKKSILEYISANRDTLVVNTKEGERLIEMIEQALED